MPFFSLLDPRAKPKGSRDPLGFELVWTRFGRQLVGNLTTITSSVENFAVALIGFALANQIAASQPKENRHAVVRDSFLRFEQVAGYLRYAYSKSKQSRGSDPNAVMGITRVRATFDNDRTDIDIGSVYPILSDQASYGMWGLYSAALRMTKLVEGDDRIPTRIGQEFAAVMIDQLPLESRSFINECAKPAGRHQITKQEVERYSGAFQRAISESETRRKLLLTLLRGGADEAPHPAQQQLFEMVENLAEANALPENIPDLIQQAQARPQYQDLNLVLTAISQLERLLVAVNRIFDFLRTQEGSEIKSVAAVMAERQFDFSHLPEVLPVVPGAGGASFANRDRLDAINTYLRKGSLELAMREIIALNDVIMQQRSGSTGSGWVYLDGDRIRVRQLREGFGLDDISQDGLMSDWDYNYFLASYLAIANRELVEEAA